MSFEGLGTRGGHCSSYNLSRSTILCIMKMKVQVTWIAILQFAKIPCWIWCYSYATIQYKIFDMQSVFIIQYSYCIVVFYGSQGLAFMMVLLDSHRDLWVTKVRRWIMHCHGMVLNCNWSNLIQVESTQVVIYMYIYIYIHATLVDFWPCVNQCIGLNW